MEKLLLDCTLRDGGYVNDWKFGRDTIVNIFERLVRRGHGHHRGGISRRQRPFDPDRSIMPDTDAVEKSTGDWTGGKSMTVAMIDYGTCSTELSAPRRRAGWTGYGSSSKKISWKRRSPTARKSRRSAIRYSRRRFPSRAIRRRSSSVLSGTPTR